MKRCASVADLPTRDDVLAAREALGARLARTPMLANRTIGARLKAELFQRTGSFKSRGALNKMISLTADEKRKGVIAISAGNHAQAVAFAAREEGVDALVVMWQGASEFKIAATRGYGAAVDLEASGTGDAFALL
jgi:threonine dehydratase